MRADAGTLNEHTLNDICEASMESVAKHWKSGRLREFQAQLLARMAAVRNGAGMRESRLGILVTGRPCLVDLRETEEIVHPMPVTPVPLTSNWYLGLANVRGSLISVIDIDHFCGAAPQTLDKASRVIVLRAAQSGSCGMLVSAVLGLRYLQDMRLQEPFQGRSVAPFIQNYIDRDKLVWSEISFASIVDDARFLHVGL
jgi:twitching motility protein PilI